jgi:phenylacetate-CoA ligase
MKDHVLHLYHRLPGPARSVVASLRGYRLRSWRYGPETERLVGEALERESWSAERWESWREERLGFLLRRAATAVPYYREQWAARRRRGDRASCEYLENWPVLEKDALRETPKAFVADDRDVRRMFHVHTSGTTGKALDVWYDRETAREWYALFEARCRRWSGVSRRDRWAILGGQLVRPAHVRRPPFWVWNAALRQLYMSSYHLAPDLMAHYLDALVSHRVGYLLGYTSSLYALAQEAQRLGRRDLRMAVVLTNAEPLFDYQRRVIEEVFQCPVRETYGMAELAAGASECEAGALHLWPEASAVEVCGGVEDEAGNVVGDLVSTGLLNDAMPLVRYRVGDRVRLARRADGERCACGRTLPRLASIEGRADDVLYTADGRRVGRLDPVFKANLPVREAQIIQEALGRIRVRYVPAQGFTRATAESITERLRARMGEVEVVLERVEEVPRGANGKFRAVVCDLPRETRAALG